MQWTHEASQEAVDNALEELHGLRARSQALLIVMRSEFL